jgi:hypothetical protein
MAKKIKCESFVNLASGSHGNILVSMTLIEILTKYSMYQPENTLVLFNLTDTARLDVPCSYAHPDKSTRIGWDKNILPFSFLSTSSELHTLIRKNIGIEQVENMSQHAIRALFSFLEQKKFNYRFMMMKNYLSNSAMADILKDYQHNLIPMTGIGMTEFCTMNNLTISGNNHHPNQQGHETLAELAYNTL